MTREIKKTVKILGTFALIFSIAMCFAGCGSGEKNGESVSNDESVSNKAEKETINIEDIEWNVDEGIVDGERYVLLDYTNNTQYTISNFEITFKEKADITEDEKAAFYSDIQQKLDASDEDMEELKEDEISMRAETNRVVNSGESVSNVNCYYYEGYYYVDNISHYDLVEPDIITVKYVDEDQIYTVYYDYSSKKYSTESETEAAYQWSQTEFGNKLPKPDVDIVENYFENEKAFRFYAYGMSFEQFNEYVEECKTFGYTVDSSGSEAYYTADNEEGYNVYLYYDENEHSMRCTLDAPAIDVE